jgi:hypothetical protein
MKRLFLFFGVLSALGLLGMVSFRVRELIAAFVLFSMGYAVLLLIVAFSMLIYRGATGAARKLRIRAPEWNRVGREWMLDSYHSLPIRYLWQRWTHRHPTSALLCRLRPSIPIEIGRGMIRSGAERTGCIAEPSFEPRKKMARARPE